MEKTGKKGSVAFGTETSPNPTLLKIPVHDMDIFIMAKKNSTTHTSILWPVWGEGDRIKPV